MRITLMPAILAIGIGLSGAAFAAGTTTQGVLKSVDMTKGQIVLSDGTAISLPKGYKGPALKAGEKVNVVWQMVGQTHQAESVTVVN